MTEGQRERVYLEYREKVAAYVGSRVSDVHTAEDLVSSVFLKVYQNLDSFDESRASLSTWIYTITRNTVINHFRLQKPSYELDEGMDSRAEGVEEELINRDMLERQAGALGRLEQRERDLIILYYYERRSLKEIAQEMGISYSGAKLIHRRALGSLRLMIA